MKPPLQAPSAAHRTDRTVVLIAVAGELPDARRLNAAGVDLARFDEVWLRIAPPAEGVADAVITSEATTRHVLAVDIPDVSSATALRQAGRQLGERLTDSQATLAWAGDLSPRQIEVLVEGIGIGRHQFGVTEVPLSQSLELDVDVTRLRRADIVAGAVNRARDLSMRSPSDLTPSRLVEAAQDVAHQFELGIEVLDEDRLRAGRYGGLLAVGAGSPHSPALVELRYRPNHNGPVIALVGKGITFDSGGLQIKTSYMEHMKADMTGAAVVLMTLAAACELELPVNLDVVLAIAENMPGPSAYRAGDVIEHSDGTTTEVTNTDAEGRLVLADALLHVRSGDAKTVVDVATLTDPFALGTEISALITTDDELGTALLRAASESGEPTWQLPLWPGYRRWLASPVATRKNYSWEYGLPSAPFAGTITAGLFLEQFTDGLSWAHLDIASTAMHPEPTGPWPAGASSAGLSTLVRWLEART